MFAKAIQKAGFLQTLFKILPLLVPFLFLFLGGLIVTLGQSFGVWLPVAPKGPIGTAYAVLLEPHVIDSVLHSLWVAFFATVASVSIGGILAYFIWLLPAYLTRVVTVYRLPLILPHIAIAFIIMIFWGQSGLIASIGHAIGCVATIEDFPPILYDGSGMGMIFAYTYKEVPFVILFAYATLKRVNPALVETARMLGAGRVMAFRKIVLPHMMPALNSSVIILFLYTFGAFDIPFLLSESSPGMVSVEVYNRYFRGELSERPEAMAILVFMFLFSFLFITGYMKLVAQLTRKGRLE